MTRELTDQEQQGTTRVRVTEQTKDELGDVRTRVAGWFARESAIRYDERLAWDGCNHVSVVADNRYGHECLYRTAGGRWVLHRWSRWRGVPATYSYVDDDHARGWLLLCEHDDAIAEYFGPVRDERRGPGRPHIGTRIAVRLPDEMLTAIDAEAERTGQPRAAVIRQRLAASVRE